MTLNDRIELIKNYVVIKSWMNNLIYKALPVGTIRQRGKYNFKKTAPGVWDRVKEDKKNNIDNDFKDIPEKLKESTPKQNRKVIDHLKDKYPETTLKKRKDIIGYQIEAREKQLSDAGIDYKKSNDLALGNLHHMHKLHEQALDEIRQKKIDEGEKRRQGLNKPEIKQEYNPKAIEGNLKKRGLGGDNLLNQIDKIDEIKDNGAEIDNNGFVTLYHRTSPENKKKIMDTGKMFGEEDGLFFSTKEKGQNEGYGNEVIKFKIPVEKLEIDDAFGEEAHLRMPAKIRQLTDMKKYMIGGNG